MPDKSLRLPKIDRLDADLLLGFVLNKERHWIVAHRDHQLSPTQYKRFSALVQRRANHEPLAHLIGSKEFYGRNFHVTKDTLIPRPETELMIDLNLPLPLLRKEGRVVVWDVGTGSGAIAVTMACENPNAIVLATDVSKKALAIAKQNARTHGVEKQITFLESNLLQPGAYRWLRKQGALSNKPPLRIMANLPYLPKADQKRLAPNVTKYEPARALYSGNDGLDLITRFLRQLARHLPEWGYRDVELFFEFDPPQVQQLKRLPKTLFPQSRVTIHKDLAGRNRVLQIYLHI